ncbi:MAG: DeoR/GlpR family DNA-binding transcription regulator [Oscillospiraceae bacterium]|nr:DeoR/GlpR family DNA-binding transcription regulator [Oscillospiraceae bacterium]
MISTQRRNKIKQLILTQGSVNTGELAELFNVTGETIRRDLNLLESEGYIKKNYGGAVAVEELHKLFNSIPPVQQRKFSNSGDKARIAMAAAQMIKEDMCVYFDAGSTTSSLLRFIECEKLNVVTNSVDIAADCAAKDNWNVVVVGGQLIKKSMCLIGSEAESHICMLNIDIAFIGSSGVSHHRSFTSSSEQEAKLKRTAISRACRSVVMADKSKFTRSYLYTFAVFNDIDCFITSEGGVDDAFRLKAKEAGMELIIV